MSKKLFLLLVALSLTLISASPNTTGPGGLNYSSGVYVANLASTTANITLTYYNQDGSVAGTVSDTIPANSSKDYYPITGVNSGFNGSLVISSSNPVAAISNLFAGNYNDAYDGANSGSQSVNIPLVMCNNSGFNTFFNVMNVGDGNDAHITVNYLPGLNGMAGFSDTATIKQYGTITFDQTIGSSTKNCTQLADAAKNRFVGSATISSDQPIVTTLEQLSTTGSFQVLMGFNGFANGSSAINLPLIEANNNGWYTGVQIQNIGSTTTTVTMTYGPNGFGSFAPVNEVFSLAAGASQTIIQNAAPPSNNSANNFTGVGKYVGSAIITNSASQPLVAIVNQVGYPSGTSTYGPMGSTYQGFNPITSSSSISVPLVMANNSGYYTGIQTQNLGSSTCASITIHYGPNIAPGGTFSPADDNFSLTAGASKTIIQNAAPPANGGVNNWTGVGVYIGAATISAPGCIIGAITNEVDLVAGDTFSTYDGINY